MVIQAFSTFFHRPRLIDKSIVIDLRVVTYYLQLNKYHICRMEILDILRSRYTTKTYDSTFHLSDKQLEDIKEMLRLCPSSINSQPWAFELIGDRETKSLLAQHSYSNKERIEQASHLLVIHNYRDVATSKQSVSPRSAKGRRSSIAIRSLLMVRPPSWAGCVVKPTSPSVLP